MNRSNAPAKVLHKLGMHPKYIGYAYIQCILSHTQQHPETAYKLAKCLYPMVMEKYNCSQTSVDRNIRFAILRTAQHGNKAEMQKLFSKFNTDWVPTNAEFICVITDYIINHLDANEKMA